MFPAMLRLLLLTGVVALLVPALAKGQVPAHDVTLTTPAGVVYGSSADASGTVTPVEAGLTVSLQQEVAGVWTSVATATTEAAGAYATPFLPATSGPLRARLGGGELSPERSLKSFRPQRSASARHGPSLVSGSMSRFSRALTRSVQGSPSAAAGGCWPGRARVSSPEF